MSVLETLRKHRRTRNAVLLIGWLCMVVGWLFGEYSWLLISFVGMNLYAYWLMLWDKRASKSGRLRIPEASLLLLAGLGGACGMLTGMLTVRHKTKHLSFIVGVPLFCLAHLSLTYLLSTITDFTSLTA